MSEEKSVHERTDIKYQGAEPCPGRAAVDLVQQLCVAAELGFGLEVALNRMVIR